MQLGSYLASIDELDFGAMGATDVTHQVTEQTTRPPSIPSPFSTSSTSSFTAATISVPPPPSRAILPILSLALPLANGATPVSRRTVRKSRRPRPSARNGGVALREDCMYARSDLESKTVAIEAIFEIICTSLPGVVRKMYTPRVSWRMARGNREGVW